MSSTQENNMFISRIFKQKILSASEPFSYKVRAPARVSIGKIKAHHFSFAVTIPALLLFNRSVCALSSSTLFSSLPDKKKFTMSSSSTFYSLDDLKNITSLQQILTHDGQTNKLSQILDKSIPVLSSKSHKGSSGRILVLGGSAKYTGAPYYAAMSALRTGLDLATICCANEATIPLKSYSPELMVEGVYLASEFDDNDNIGNDRLLKESLEKMVEKVTMNLDRMHSLVVGPGLGRCPHVLKATATIIQQAMKKDISIVIDADGLYLLSLEENRDMLLSGIIDKSSKSKIVLTPNVVEYKRLIETIGHGSEEDLRLKLPGVIIVRKGHHDVIEYSPRSHYLDGTTAQLTMICSEQGGLKRSGGIGDILAGTIGAFVAWNKILESSKKGKQCSDYKNDDRVDLVLACWIACCVTKRATFRAFEERKRSMTAPDILNYVGEVVDEISSSTIHH